jgi:hypothetical protein
MIAPGVIGSWDGLVLGYGTGEVPVGADACSPSPAIAYGRYKVVAWRGIEYDRWEGEVDLSADRGRVELAIPLHRAWTPHGTLAADLHVHAFASEDSKMPNQQRVLAQVSTGIQVIGLSDHNTSGDLAAEIKELKLGGVVASIASNELTADGDTAMPLEQTGWYQRDKWKRPGVTPFAIASPILVDADGDGRWKRGDADLPIPPRD